MKQLALSLRDGRMLSISMFGDPDGTPVLYVHGVGSSRLEAAIGEEAAASNSLRIISVDRPGYGLSTPDPHGTFLQFSKDIDEVMNHFEIQRCSLIGVGCGGPYAATSTSLLKGRISELHLVGSLGPTEDPELFRLLDTSLKAPLQTIQEAPDLLRTRWEQTNMEDKIFQTESEQLSREERQYVTPFILDKWRFAVQESAHSAEGYLRDLQTLMTPWAYHLENIDTPAYIWAGEEDEIIPLRHAVYLANHIESSKLETFPGMGHIATEVLGINTALQQISKNRALL